MSSVYVKFGVAPLSRWGAALRLLVFFSFSIYLLIPAQKQPFTRSIQLQDGSIVEGQITSQPLGFAVRLASGEIRFVATEEVKEGPVDLEGFSFPRWIPVLAMLPALLFLPYFFFALVYGLSAFLSSLLNGIHGQLMGRSQADIDRFLGQCIYFRLKVCMSLLGLTDARPHLDVSSREASAYPLLFGYRSGSVGPLHFFLLTTGLSRLFLLPWYILSGMLWLLTAVLSPVLWLLILLRAEVPETLLSAIERLFAFSAALQATGSGLISGPPSVYRILRESVAEDLPEGYVSTFGPLQLEQNLVVLHTLLLLSGGLYAYFWLARIARIMGYDVFSVVTSAIMMPPLVGMYFLRFYRRAEKLVRQESGSVPEVICLLPLLNLLVAPGMIQLILNEYERARKQQREA
ncbi:MAG: hypothetical protein HS115_04915 [Spirochaetales bacterium]|nr:hypothetical protein [Spirochaetales bacterium]